MMNFLMFVPKAIAASEELNAKVGAISQNQKELRRAIAIEESNAVSALSRGALQAGNRRMAATQLEGKQRQAYAIGGIDTSSGTAKQTMHSSGVFAELDAATLQNNAIRQAFGHTESARKYQVAHDELNKQYASASREFYTTNATNFASAAMDLVGGGAGGGAGGMAGGMSSFLGGLK